MPSNTSRYISDEYITLDQIVGEFSQNLSKLVKSKQRPLILELKRRGMSIPEIASLLGVTRQSVYYTIGKQNDKTNL